MKTITIREFRNNLKKYLDMVDNGVHVEIKRGNSVYTLSNGVHKELTFPKSPEEVLVETKQSVATPVKQESFTVYGCGCKKTDKALCAKHGRY